MLLLQWSSQRWLRGDDDDHHHRHEKDQRLLLLSLRFLLSFHFRFFMSRNVFLVSFPVFDFFFPFFFGDCVETEHPFKPCFVLLAALLVFHASIAIQFLSAFMLFPISVSQNSCLPLEEIEFSWIWITCMKISLLFQFFSIFDSGNKTEFIFPFLCISLLNNHPYLKVTLEPPLVNRMLNCIERTRCEIDRNSSTLFSVWFIE